MTDDTGGEKDLPFLEHLQAGDEVAARTVIHTLPFVIGRTPPADLVIHSQLVSKRHATIQFDGEEFRLDDLESSNGTFVNGERVTSRTIRDGDVIHVAQTELRFGYDPAGGDLPDATVVTQVEGLQRLFENTRSLQRILAEGLVRAVYQPIVHLRDGAPHGFEALGRAPEDVDLNPQQLFEIAEARDKGAELSRRMRAAAIEQAERLPGDPVSLFLNLHPSEMDEPELLDQLRSVRARLPDRIQPVIEIHESAITDVAEMARFRADLETIGLRLAYDDFGAGQSRLMELADVPPHFIKLDMGLIRGIDESVSRRELVRALTRVMVDQGVCVLAEGIETEGERAACIDVGCTLGQGYLFGRPEPAP